MRYLYRSYCLKEGGFWSGACYGNEKTNQSKKKRKECHRKQELVLEATGSLSCLDQELN